MDDLLLVEIGKRIQSRRKQLAYQMGPLYPGVFLFL